jgi:hypothetical protein
MGMPMEHLHSKDEKQSALDKLFDAYFPGSVIELLVDSAHTHLSPEEFAKEAEKRNARDDEFLRSIKGFIR